ncbi:aldo/keto reductase [Galbibacter sp. BG1]|uniref:aldo/keto reductase n=1 Tax=Galbibacter sp. BG1 TaxID=1170699 RepID=UPI002106FE2D|nr:aldo/keto reductase [Galbibacter sp. BG1]
MNSLFLQKRGTICGRGPYGNWGSRKYLISSLDQSLRRMKLDYVDIFYHHRPDPNMPLEETMGALDQIVRQGKALYVGVSNYKAEETQQAAKILKEQGTPFLIHQPRYNMMDRWVEDGLLDVFTKTGIGSIAFSPLEQGILTSKYLGGIPEDSRAAKKGTYLDSSKITPELISKIKALNEIAVKRGQSLAQMAIAWLLKDERITSVLIGVSKVSQLKDNLEALNNIKFTKTELNMIDKIILEK